MKWRPKIHILESRDYEIKYDKSVGYYLFVYENRKCIRDHLQESLLETLEFAKETYGIPISSWVEIE